MLGEINMDILEMLRNPFFSDIDYNKSVDLIDKGVVLKREGKIEAALDALLVAHSYFPDVDVLQAIAKSLYIYGEYRLGLDYYLWSWLADLSFRMKKYESLNLSIDKLFVQMVNNSNGWEQGINLLRHIGYFVARLQNEEKLLPQIILEGNSCWLPSFNGKINIELITSADCMQRYKKSISGLGGSVTDEEDTEAIKLALSVLLNICKNPIYYSNFIDKKFKPLSQIIVPTNPVHIANITDEVLPRLGLYR